MRSGFRVRIASETSEIRSVGNRCRHPAPLHHHRHAQIEPVQGFLRTDVRKWAESKANPRTRCNGIGMDIAPPQIRTTVEPEVAKSLAHLAKAGSERESSVSRAFELVNFAVSAAPQTSELEGITTCLPPFERNRGVFGLFLPLLLLL